MFAGLTAYFLIMHALNLSNRFDFRVLNGVIHISLLYLAIRDFRRLHPDRFNYLSGVATGMVTTVFGVLPFALFQLIHLALNDSFMQYLQENAPLIGNYLTPFSAALVVFLEGIGVGFIASYILMRIVDARFRKLEEKNG
jgi:hypothetical protein